MILIVGATGDLGGHVARQLLANGKPVRAMTRDPARANALKLAGAEIVRGDVRDIQSLHAATRGVRTVISASHAMLGTGDGSVQRVDVDGQASLIAAAKQAGVEHFVFVSAAGASLDHPIDFWRAKAAVEQKLAASGLTYTILRPGAFMAMHAFVLIGKPIVERKRVMLLGPGTNPRNFIASSDVAQFVELALRDEALRGETIDVGGPENLSNLQVVELFEKLAGVRAKVSHIPLPAVRVLGGLVNPLHAGVGRVLKASVVNETTDQTFDAAALRARFPIQLTRMEDWARDFLASRSPSESRPVR